MIYEDSSKWHDITSDFELTKYTEIERWSGWLPWWSLETLKLAFNLPSDDQGSHPDHLSISVHELRSWVSHELTFVNVWRKLTMSWCGCTVISIQLKYMHIYIYMCVCVWVFMKWWLTHQIFFSAHAVMCHYSTVQYNMISHTTLQWLNQYIYQSLNSQLTSHTSPIAVRCLLWGIWKELIVLKWHHRYFF